MGWAWCTVGVSCGLLTVSVFPRCRASEPMEEEEQRKGGGAEERRGGGAEESRGGEEERLIDPEAVQLVVRPKAGSPSSPSEDPRYHSGSSRKSFRLDYRLEEDVTRSQRDAGGRFINPWSTWSFPSYATMIRLFLTEKNHSNVPSSKEVGHTHTHTHTHTHQNQILLAK